MRGLAMLLVGVFAVGCGGATVGSIGALLGRDNDTHALTVREVPKGLAAAEAGLVPGDEIVMIDGFYVRDLGPKELHALLRGDVGSKVELTIVRAGDVRRVVVTRTALRQPLLPTPRVEPPRE